MITRRIRRVLPVVVAACSTFGILLATNTFASPSTSSPRGADRVAAASTHGHHAHHHVSLGLTAHFRVLRLHATQVVAASTGPALPGDLGDVPGFGTDPSQAHYVQLGGFGVWVVPGSSGVCLFVPVSLPRGTLYRGRCNTVGAAESGGFRGIFGRPGSQVAFGLVPDGNGSVTVTHSDGSTTTTPVVDNVYATSAEHVVSITVHDAGGHAVDLPTSLPSTMKG